MFDLRIRFSIIGVIIFMLPMLINILYFVKGAPESAPVEQTSKILEFIEQGTRVLYCIAICFLVSKQEISYKSPWLYIGFVFLVLYYIVWIRYFTGGMQESLLSKSFLCIPMPLAVFPVLYFICEAIWVKNYIAVIFMIIFGMAHNAVSYINLKAN